MRTILEAFNDAETWETRDGRVIPINELTEEHARNILAHMERQAGRYKFALEMWYDMNEPDSNGAWNAWTLECVHIENADAVELARDTPAYKAVAERLASFA